MCFIAALMMRADLHGSLTNSDNAHTLKLCFSQQTRQKLRAVRYMCGSFDLVHFVHCKCKKEYNKLYAGTKKDDRPYKPDPEDSVRYFWTLDS